MTTWKKLLIVLDAYVYDMFNVRLAHLYDSCCHKPLTYFATKAVEGAADRRNAGGGTQEKKKDTEVRPNVAGGGAIHIGAEVFPLEPEIDDVQNTMNSVDTELFSACTDKERLSSDLLIRKWYERRSDVDSDNYTYQTEKSLPLTDDKLNIPLRPGHYAVLSHGGGQTRSLLIWKDGIGWDMVRCLSLGTQEEEKKTTGPLTSCSTNYDNSYNSDGTSACNTNAESNNHTNISMFGSVPKPLEASPKSDVCYFMAVKDSDKYFCRLGDVRLFSRKGAPSVHSDFYGIWIHCNGSVIDGSHLDEKARFMLENMGDKNDKMDGNYRSPTFCCK